MTLAVVVVLLALIGWLMVADLRRRDAEEREWRRG